LLSPFLSLFKPAVFRFKSTAGGLSLSFFLRISFGSEFCLEEEKLKKRELILLITCVALALVLVAIACTQAVAPATTTTPAQTATTKAATTTVPAPATGVAKDKTYRAVNPAGMFIPVQTKPLAARLDTIDGKTIYVCQGEADPVIMPALYKRLVKDYPKTKWIYYDRSDFGPNVPGSGGSATSTGQPEDPDILKKVQGVIRGNGW
jgi:hypothetical protein